MKKIILSLLIAIISFSGYSQIQNPVKWKYTVEKNGTENATLVITAKIDKGWHLYSQFVGDGGPIPTTIKFKSSNEYTLVGKTEESPKPHTVYEELFGMKVPFFEGNATFKQKIKVTSAKDFKVNGTLEFMVCDDKQCLPPEEMEISFDVKGAAVAVDNLKIEESKIVSNDTANSTIASNTPTLDSAKSDTTKSLADSTLGKSPEADNSMWGIFFQGFLFGFVALLMPCIFPMIPLTVSFFTKQSKSRAVGIRKALIYGLSIVVIYVALGLGITILLGASALNELSSDAIFNLVFFFVLVVFATSFFGAFEITLPSSWSTKADQKADKGGLLGIFFMAVVLAIASFSCTGPLIGTLLVDAANKGQYMGPFLGMLGFSLSLALPFTLFAIFPSWLNSMPKSGGWLNSVKVTLGFIELAFALKFLSNVDMAYHWRILDREVFIVLWVIIFAMLGFYLLGKLRFAHDSEVKHVSVTRLFLSIITLSFALYLVPGLWGAPLKAVSGFLPHQGTQDFDLYTRTFTSSSSDASHSSGTKKYADRLHAPLGIDAFFDYEEGLAYAKKVGKPVFLDFTGHSCTNCRKMENAVWPNPEVLKRLKNDFVVISLYVDDRTELPEAEKYVSKYTGKKVKTLGNRNVDLQVSKFNSNAQPLYVIVDAEGNPLTVTHGYKEDIEGYISFLDSWRKR
jgi:thiol:disulfide interchange protein DsbD